MRPFASIDSLPTSTLARIGVVLVATGCLALGILQPRLGPGDVVLLYAALFAPYGLVLLGVADGETPSAWWLIVAAVVARVALMPAPPVLSDDIYRYVWDGRVWLDGINPFVHAPDAEALAHLRDAAIWPNVNHPEVPTIYPPGAQYLFGLNALLGGGVTTLKGLMLLVEGAAVAGCARVLAADGSSASDDERDPRRTIFAIYALNPLVVVELAWSGHVDAVAWSLLALGLLLWQRQSRRGDRWWGALAVGASAAVKFLSLLAIPLMWFGTSEVFAEDAAESPVWERFAAPMLVPAVVAVSYLPFLSAGPQLFDGLQTYADRWRSNDGGYRVTARFAEHALRSADPGALEHVSRSGDQLLFRFEAWNATFERLGWTEEWRGREIPATTFTAEELAGLLARAVAVLALLMAVGWAAVTRAPPLAAFAGSLFVLYLFAPVVHPWYVAWLVPAAALADEWYPLAFSALTIIGYIAWISSQQGAPWRVPDALVALEYGLVLLALYAERIYRAPPGAQPPDSR